MTSNLLNAINLFLESCYLSRCVNLSHNQFLSVILSKINFTLIILFLLCPKPKQEFITSLAERAGKMKRALCSYWLPEIGKPLPEGRDIPPWPCKEKGSLGQWFNPLLTKLVSSRWLDIRFFFFLIKGFALTIVLKQRPVANQKCLLLISQVVRLFIRGNKNYQNGNGTCTIHTDKVIRN